MRKYRVNIRGNDGMLLRTSDHWTLMAARREVRIVTNDFVWRYRNRVLRNSTFKWEIKRRYKDEHGYVRFDYVETGGSDLFLREAAKEIS